MEKIWLKHYQEGVPAEITLDRYKSLVDMFEQSCAKFRDKTAFINYGTEMTYGEFERSSYYLAAYFQQVLGLQAGERIALMMPNILQYPVAIFAALRAGLIVVNVNPLYTADELTHQVNDAQCKAILVLENFAHTVASALPNTKLEHVMVTQMGDLLGTMKGMLVNLVVKHVKRIVPAYSIPNVLLFKDLLVQGKKHDVKRCDINIEDIAFLQYTGGTTGVSKGAELSHRNLLANLEQASAWVQSRLREGEEVVATPLPLYHIFSLTANLLLFTKLGGKNLLITNPRDINDFIKQLKAQPVTVLIGVNTLFNALLNTPAFTTLDFSQLNMSLGGGAAIHESVAKNWQQTTGCTLLEAYGLTEASPLVTASPLNADEHTGSIGLPVPSTEVSIRNQEGNEVAVGEVGELCIRGPQIMSGYWQQEEETKKILSDDGWLRTGDLVTMDDKGFITIVDRIKDLILVSGFNVYPNEIEDIIASHPGVAEVGVVGVEDETTGEMVQAHIVKADPNVTEQSIIRHCREHLTSYKVPKKIIFADELPKTNVGKILRRHLRAAEIA